ncbi:Zinc finger C2H2, partial [Penicillium mononematosum]|uniref:Zinc finger C2H2 n=1 Tax=Penicillium mononematosum TaxID=268346 RepID=UPI00254834DE
TQETPYRCSVSNKRFGLHNDLLSRHSTLYDPNRDSASTKRRCIEGNSALTRASQACEGCAENHLRCDDGKPCRRYQRKGFRCNLPTGSVEGTPPTPATRLEVNAPGNDGNPLSPLQLPQQPHQPQTVGGPCASLGFSNQIGSVSPGSYSRWLHGPGR